jgi:hypothetical protein
MEKKSGAGWFVGDVRRGGCRDRTRRSVDQATPGAEFVLGAAAGECDAAVEGRYKRAFGRRTAFG